MNGRGIESFVYRIARMYRLSGAKGRSIGPRIRKIAYSRAEKFKRVFSLHFAAMTRFRRFGLIKKKKKKKYSAFTVRAISDGNSETVLETLLSEIENKIRFDGKRCFVLCTILLILFPSPFS